MSVRPKAIYLEVILFCRWQFVFCFLVPFCLMTLSIILADQGKTMIGSLFRLDLKSDKSLRPNAVAHYVKSFSFILTLNIIIVFPNKILLFGKPTRYCFVYLQALS